MSKNITQHFSDTAPFFSTNVVFINELYQNYLANPASIDPSWADFFANNKSEVEEILSDYNGPSWSKRELKVVKAAEYDISNDTKKEAPKSKSKAVSGQKNLNVRLDALILAYKEHGHLAANLDPLNLTPRVNVPDLELENHDIEESDLNKEVHLDGKLNLQKAKLSDAINQLKSIYAQNVGFEFEYMLDVPKKEWLAKETEKTFTTDLDASEKRKVLNELIRTQKFEEFLHKRFPGAKRFSVEGGESSICAVEKVIEEGADLGVKKIIIGMAHRGRLNTLTGIMGKPYHEMIAEFQGVPGLPEGITRSGDVKYHMGYASTREINGRRIDLSLAFNPSHLEAVNTVVTGRIRAKQDEFGDKDRAQAMAILIHGDAAFAGQGCVAESLVMNGVDGYDTGGVMHIIVNNQVGFTANPTDSRSTRYASDLAKSIDAPIFHVNGDDVESVVKVAGLAMRYRQQFKKDVVIDVICYRKYGHNEGDEPLYTQPVMYSVIKSHPTICDIYSKELESKNIVSKADYEKYVADFNDHLSKEFDKAKTYKATNANWLEANWSKVKEDKNIPNTNVSQKDLKELAHKVTHIPEGFNANKKIAKLLAQRNEIVESAENIDWGTAESLAFASLINEGHKVRITGQDSGRGTFSHRHSVLHDAKDGSEYAVFDSLNDKANYEVHDSVLSEYGVLGFEYGYSLSAPNALTIWEAQFGDFANGAQIMFDQFIASSEVKWLRKSGLVMLLPHGFEGQGPEHSSARLERYLQACADNNLRVCNITKPANFFHALRRQLHSNDRKPLVIMSPKSLLRHKLNVSNLSEFSDLNFRSVIAEEEKIAANDKVKKVVLCSGKVYYDLLEARTEKKIKDIALIRVEQFYPFPKEELAAEIKKYKNADVIWCQEEPKNMGAWKFVDDLIEETLLSIKHKTKRPTYVGRIACASPATGYAKYHKNEQETLIKEALS